MKKFILILVFGLLMLPGFSQPSQTGKRTKVLILGTFHFVSNEDGIKFKREDMLSEKRQKEIDDLNNSLARFSPDKIFIEWTPVYQRYVDSTYAAYQKGNFKIDGNEVFQVGYKLAKKLGHATVYCMDAPGLYRMDTVISTAKKYGQYEPIEKEYIKWRDAILIQDSLQKLLTIKQRLREVNKKENIMNSHMGNAAVTVAPYVGKPGDYAGALFMGEWYKRNIRMYSNIVRIAQPPDDAILIIVGSGHARIIRHFFEDNPAFEVIDPAKYLK